MSDRITTEEVERIAGELAAGWDSERLRGRACVAIRSLAAEVDELREGLRGIVEDANPWCYGDCGEAARTALGENQP